jgi:hypothetical protein
MLIKHLFEHFTPNCADCLSISGKASTSTAVKKVTTGSKKVVVKEEDKKNIKPSKTTTKVTFRIAGKFFFSLEHISIL